MNLDKRLRDLEQRARRESVDNVHGFDLPDDALAHELAERLTAAAARLPVVYGVNAQVRTLLADRPALEAANALARRLAVLRDTEQARNANARFGWRPA